MVDETEVTQKLGLDDAEQTHGRDLEDVQLEARVAVHTHGRGLHDLQLKCGKRKLTRN